MYDKYNVAWYSRSWLCADISKWSEGLKDQALFLLLVEDYFSVLEQYNSYMANVSVAPTKVTITGTRDAKVNETVKLTCTTTNSNPAAAITWLPQSGGTTNSRTEDSPDGGKITISEIDIRLTGTNDKLIYTCSAANDLGVVTASTTVGVLCKW